MNEISKHNGTLEKNRAEIGYTTPVLLQALLPYRKTEEKIITRVNGANTLHLSSPNGMPYGRYVRYIVAYLTTQAYIRAKDLKDGTIKNEEEARTIPLGNTFNDFLRSIGLDQQNHKVGGQRIRNIREQLQRLGALSIVFEERITDRDKLKNFRVIEEQEYYYGTDPNQGQLFDPFIKLDKEFFNVVAKNGVPFDLNILKELRKPVAMDFYLWATYNVFTQSKYGGISKSWTQLREMFGINYQDTTQGRKDFKKEFRKALEDIAKHWTTFHYEETGEGIYLPPQAPSITPNDTETEEIKKMIADSPLGEFLEK